MVHTIVLNSTNIQGQNNNRFVYDLAGTKSVEGCQIALNSLYMYYSWTNINSSPNANNTYSITFPPLDVDFSGNALDDPIPETTYTIVMPDGIYDIDAVNYYLQNFCIDNNLYMSNSNGENVYFLQLQINLNQYKIQFNVFSIPCGGLIPADLSMPLGGFSNNSTTGNNYPNGAFPSAGTYVAPGWYFPDNFDGFVGFSSPTYKPSADQKYFILDQAYPLGAASFLGDQAPNAQPNDILYVNCNLVKNNWANPSTFLYPIAAGGNSIGTQIRVEPPEFSYNNMQPGVASQLIVTITTKTGADIKILDPATIIVLLVKEPSDRFLPVGPHSIQGQPSAPNMWQMSKGSNHTSANDQLTNLHRKINKYN